jgi:hypothetical protein
MYLAHRFDVFKSSRNTRGKPSVAPGCLEQAKLAAQLLFLHRQFLLIKLGEPTG